MNENAPAQPETALPAYEFSPEGLEFILNRAARQLNIAHGSEEAARTLVKPYIDNSLTDAEIGFLARRLQSNAEEEVVVTREAFDKVFPRSDGDSWGTEINNRAQALRDEEAGSRA